MTLFRFDELTWPEIAALPRNTPLVLPLGSLPDPGTTLRTDPDFRTHWPASGHPFRLARQRAGSPGRDF